MENIGKQAKEASWELYRLPAQLKDELLRELAAALRAASTGLVQANEADRQAARAAGQNAAFIDRLTLTPARIDGVAADLCSVADLPNPVGEVFDQKTMPNGLRVHKRRVPIGVLGVIYEARPNVTVDVTGLAFKTGNAVILRGSSDTLRSNTALVEIIHRTFARYGVPQAAVQLITDPDRARVLDLLHLHEYVDLIIPRGGAALHQFCRENSRIPVITGGIGICHLFVEATADLDGAERVIFNAKTQRPTVCNALDTVLVQRDAAAGLLERILPGLRTAGVQFRLDETVLPYLPGNPGSLPEGAAPAGPDDFDTEWLSLVLGIKVVDSLDEAVEHIRRHSTGHSDGILTQNPALAAEFVERVDSAAVYVNASTRFTDGSQLGLGAEVAISTQKLHARGPMALQELTSYKWVIEGDNHMRA